MAGAGGIFPAGQIQSASRTSGGGNLLMNVIAAAVVVDSLSRRSQKAAGRA
ncbi:hypothetical protein [Streptomyces sp. AC154]|uniref:hypothetical protein n=1 Tax=Streptomyces sp. AC154 TaxID=3143184 RepID=UPI003F81DCB7